MATGKSGRSSGEALSDHLEVLTTPLAARPRKVAVKMPSVGDISWHDLRGTFGFLDGQIAGRAAEEARSATPASTVPKVHGADVASPTLKKLQGKLQGRSKSELVRKAK